jgi:hypothetical protein
MVGNSPGLLRPIRSLARLSAVSHCSLVAFDFVFKTDPETLTLPCTVQSNPSASPVLSSGLASLLQIGQTVISGLSQLGFETGVGISNEKGCELTGIPVLGYLFCGPFPPSASLPAEISWNYFQPTMVGTE